LVAVAYASRAGYMRMRDKVTTRIETFKKAFAIVTGLTGMAIFTGGKRLEALITDNSQWWVNLVTLI
jgi:cytochrome c-type biogenesis protein